jgi:membrane protein implicated in regulation of membrane protease activity
VWIIGAILLGIFEVLAPAQIFLGFAMGAAAVGGALLIGIPGLAGSIPAMLMVFAVASLVAWLLIRRLLGVRKGQVKIIKTDINEH